MPRHSKHLKTIGLVLAGASLMALSACDQRQERVERAGELSQAVIDQVLGNETETANRLDKVPQAARSFARLSPAATVSTNEDAAPRRFVIGSIVAKPRDLAPTIAMAEVMAQPALADDILVDGQAEAKIVVLDEKATAEAEADPDVIAKIERKSTASRSISVIDPKAVTQTRSISRDTVVLPRKTLSEKIYTNRQAQGGLPAPRAIRSIAAPKTREEIIEAMPQMKPQLAERALTLRKDTLIKQMSAEDRMIEAATKYGIAASIQRSRSGQMVLEVGSEAMRPTQFSGDNMVQPSFAVETDIVCDENTAMQASGDAVIAMECVIQDLQSTGEFEYVEKDYLFDHQMIGRPGDAPTTPISITPDDPLFDLQWHYKDQGNDEGQSEGGAGFVDFWTSQATQGSPDVVVAVIDTGLEMAHPEIAGSANVAPGWDMVTDPNTGNDGDGRDSNPDDPGDMCPERGALTNSFHGTHVAGTIGAGITDNNTGVAGGAWNVKIVPVRALGKCGGRLSDINDAIRWAAGTIPEYDELGNEVWNENPADIINLSLGLFKACPASMQDAIDAVTDEGVVVVAAAGNKRISTDFFAPAGCRNVVTVAAGDARGFLAPYSNFGDDVDILAPGGDLARDDNGDGNPDGILSTKTAENCVDPVTNEQVDNCYYAYEQGTSMAAPHVSAALALIKAKRPDLTADQLVSRLTNGLTSIPVAQCTGPCSQFPGAEPIADDPNMCLRECGAGLLNLADVDLAD